MSGSLVGKTAKGLSASHVDLAHHARCTGLGRGYEGTRHPFRFLRRAQGSAPRWRRPPRGVPRSATSRRADDGRARPSRESAWAGDHSPGPPSPRARRSCCARHGRSARRSGARRGPGPQVASRSPSRILVRPIVTMIHHSSLFPYPRPCANISLRIERLARNRCYPQRVRVHLQQVSRLPRLQSLQIHQIEDFSLPHRQLPHKGPNQSQRSLHLDLDRADHPAEDVSARADHSAFSANRWSCLLLRW